MEYYHINKKQIVSGIINDSIIGYVTTKENADYIHNNNNGNTFDAWKNENIEDLQSHIKSLEDFFEENPSILFIYESITKTNYIDIECGYIDNLITDLGNPES